MAQRRLPLHIRRGFKVASQTPVLTVRAVVQEPLGIVRIDGRRYRYFPVSAPAWVEA